MRKDIFRGIVFRGIILLVGFALGMFINKWMSLDEHKQVVGKVVDIKPGEKVIQLNPKKEDYNCSALKKNDGTFLSFCVRKEEIKKEIDDKDKEP